MQPGISGKKTSAGNHDGSKAKRGGPPKLAIGERYAVTVPTAASFIGISRTRIYEYLKAGLIEGRVVGGRRIVIVKSLMRLVGKSPSTRRDAA